MVEDGELKQCQYFLVRYVPDVVKQEFINIGLFLFCRAEQFLDCLFSDDFRRITRFHAQADTQFLKELQLHFEQQIEEHEADLEGYIHEMQQSYSNLIQLSPARTCLTADLRAQLQDLFERYVGARLTGPTKQDTRMRIKHRMTESLRRCGVYDHELFEKRIPASQWTGAGDPFAFDFGYKPPEQAGKPNGRLKLIHTLSLQRDSELAKALKLSFDRVLVKESSHLTVGHEDILDPDNAVVCFSQGILEDERIRLVPVSGFDKYAQSIREELFM
ncbi:MAG: DUF3037 domain-containing protein [Terriglobia bacterium]|jgi:hypothetical protein